MSFPITFSHLENYRNCPRQFYERYVLKIHPFVETEATRWGNTVHKAIEDCINDGTPLPVGMQQWQKYVNTVKATPGEKYVEKEYALDNNFLPTTWAGSWTRGKGDLCIVNKSTGLILDWKTGKYKPGSEQLRLYAAMLFAHHPELATVHTRYVWLATKQETPETIHRDQLPEVWQSLLPRYRSIESALERDAWPPRPSGLCRGWCPCKTCDYYKPPRK